MEHLFNCHGEWTLLIQSSPLLVSIFLMARHRISCLVKFFFGSSHECDHVHDEPK